MPSDYDRQIERIMIIKNSIVKARRARKFVQRDMVLNTSMVELGISWYEADEIIRSLIKSNFLSENEGELFLSAEQEKELEDEYCKNLGVPQWSDKSPEEKVRLAKIAQEEADLKNGYVNPKGIKYNDT